MFIKNKDDFKTGSLYAKSLFAASENHGLTQMFHDLEKLQTFFDGSDFNSLIHKFTSSIHTSELQIEDLVKKIKKGLDLSDYSCNFLHIIFTNKKTYLINYIAKVFRSLYFTHENKIEVQITSAHKLADEETQKITKYLHKTYSQELIIFNNIDPSIIAGYIIKIQDKEIDLSIINRVYDIKKHVIDSIRTIQFVDHN